MAASVSRVGSRPTDSFPISSESETLTKVSYLNVSAGDSITDEVWQATDLQKLNVTPLDGGLLSLSDRIGELRKLTHLSLAGHRLKTLPETLTTLPLEYLDVSNNRLESLPPQFQDLKTLRELNITGNNDLHLPPDFFCALENLHTQADWTMFVLPLIMLCKALETGDNPLKNRAFLELDPSLKSLMCFFYTKYFPSENLQDCQWIETHLFDCPNKAVKITYETLINFVKKWKDCPIKLTIDLESDSLSLRQKAHTIIACFNQVYKIKLEHLLGAQLSQYIKES